MQNIQACANQTTEEGIKHIARLLLIEMNLHFMFLLGALFSFFRIIRGWDRIR